MVQLLTFGSLHLQGVAFGREKPLLLLAYLCLNGPQPRRTVARRFWPDAANPMNSLSVALGQLRKISPDLFHATETQVGTALPCDALEFQQATLQRDLDTARNLYQGMFLADLSDEEIGEELEEWVMQTREQFADSYRTLLLSEARHQLALNPAQAAEYAALAHRIPGATPPGAEIYRELHALLSAAGHADAAKVLREAAEDGVNLTQSAAPAVPLAPLLGRQSELKRLTELQPGEVLWLRGAPGLGKTALLRAAATRRGELLSGRSGQPYLTLRPLTSQPLNDQEWTQHLTQQREGLLIDDWEAADPESRRVLLHVARSRAGGPIVIASRERPPAECPELVLRPMTEGLTADVLEQTGGIPALLHAVQSGQPLADAYANLLAPHTPRARQLLTALSLQAQPHLSATQTALHLSADDMAETLETLRRAWLLNQHAVTAPAAQRAWLDAQPSLETEVLTLLAPHLNATDALALYLRAHALTGASDFPGFQHALAQHARHLIRQGRDVEAHDLLTPHAQTPETRLLLARTQDALGHYPDALNTLSPLEKTPLVQAYLGRVLFRLGKLDEATQAAQEALKGDLEAKAQAYNLLGALDMAKQEYVQARDNYERAAGLFMLTGDDSSRLRARCIQAVAMHELGLKTDEIVREIQSSPPEHLHPDILLNIGWLVERQGNLDDALAFATSAARRAQQVQHLVAAASAWNNVGVLHHKLKDVKAAAQAYQHAVLLARSTGDVRLLALGLGNLAELQESLPLLEEALGIADDAKLNDLAAYFREQLALFRGRSGGS